MRWCLATMLMAITLSGCLNLRRQYRDSDAAVPDAAEDHTNDVSLSDGGVDANTPRYPVEVSAGNGHTCARLSDGSIWCWGGVGSQIQRSPRRLEAIDEPSSVLSVQLGMGDELHRCVRRADSFECRGPGDLAEAFSEPGIVELSVGAAFQCTRSNNGRVRCLGNNLSGQIDSLSSMAADVVLVEAGALSVSAGFSHQCIVVADGSVGCQGANSQGQSAPNSPGPAVSRTQIELGANVVARSVACGTDFSCALASGSGVYCWGVELGGFGTSGPHLVPSTSAFVDVDAGHAHACGIDAGRQLFCWGENLNGQLGTDTTLPETQPKQVVGIGLVQSFSAGTNHTCAITLDGGLWCWGSNAAGQLGVGSEGVQFNLPQRVIFPTQ